MLLLFLNAFTFVLGNYMKKQTTSLLFILLFPLVTFAQGIRGKIIAEEQPLECTVQLTFKQKTKSTKSDKEGKFFFPFVDTGTYFLKIEDFDYSPFLDTIYITTLKEVVLKDIYLNSKMQFLKEVEIPNTPNS